MLKSPEVNKANTAKISSLSAEILFREAEDSFYHFNDDNKAFECLDKSLKYNPYLLKAWILKGDIKLTQNDLKMALCFYEKAISIDSDNPKALASLACCLDMLEDYHLALKYCQKALQKINMTCINLYPSLCELHLGLLIKLKKYDKADAVLKNSVYNLPSEEINFLRACNQRLVKKKTRSFERFKSSNWKVISSVSST